MPQPLTGRRALGPRRPSRAKCRSRGRDRGATMTEMAFVGPLLMLLLFGIIEMGGVMKSYSGVSNSTVAGGRAAAIAGNDVLADQAILAAMSTGAAAVGKNEITYIIIWKPVVSGESPPASCLALATGSTYNTQSVGISDGGIDSAGACNVYVMPDRSGGAFDMAMGRAANPSTYYFGCTGPTATTTYKLDCKWSAKNRKVSISPRSTASGSAVYADYLGVAIGSSHNYYTRLFGTSKTINRSTTVLLEPKIYAVTDTN